MPARIAPADPPFDPQVAAVIDAVMRGQPPLQLFTILARDPRLAMKFFNGGLLDKGNLTLRQREIVIDRTTALCRSEYEWGVHIANFGPKAGITPEQARSTAAGSAQDSCWHDEDRLLIRLCDALHRDCDVSDSLWADLRSAFTENALVEMLLLAGFYRTVSYLTNALRIPNESFGARFPAE